MGRKNVFLVRFVAAREGAGKNRPIGQPLVVAEEEILCIEGKKTSTRETHFRGGGGFILALAIALVLASAAGARAAAPTVSAGWLPFEGGLHDSQTGSNINLNGLVHIVTRWQATSASEAKVSVYANLPAADVFVTTNTGIPYIALGAGKSTVFFPNDPMRFVVPTFLLMVVGSDRAFPNDPMLPVIFALQLDLVFFADGVLDFGLSTVQVIEPPGLGD